MKQIPTWEWDENANHWVPFTVNFYFEQTLLPQLTRKWQLLPFLFLLTCASFFFSFYLSLFVSPTPTGVRCWTIFFYSFCLPLLPVSLLSYSSAFAWFSIIIDVGVVIEWLKNTSRHQLMQLKSSEIRSEHSILRRRVIHFVNLPLSTIYKVPRLKMDASATSSRSCPCEGKSPIDWPRRSRWNKHAITEGAFVTSIHLTAWVTFTSRMQQDKENTRRS